MTFRRFRVEIDGEPFMLRSAILACLDGDPRFDVVLAGADAASVNDVTAHADLWSVPPPTQVRLTVAVDAPMRLRLLHNGGTHHIPDQGMRRLGDALMQALDNCESWTTETDIAHTEIAVTHHA